MADGGRHPPEGVRKLGPNLAPHFFRTPLYTGRLENKMTCWLRFIICPHFSSPDRALSCPSSLPTGAKTKWRRGKGAAAGRQLASVSPSSIFQSIGSICLAGLLACLAKVSQLKATQPIKSAPWSPGGKSLSLLVFAGPIVPSLRVVSAPRRIHIARLCIRSAVTFLLSM